MQPTDPPATGQAPRFVRLLRLVSPAPAPTPRKARQRPPPLFTPDEEARIRASLKTARGLFGTYSCLAAAMYMSKNRVQRVAGGQAAVTAAVAIRLAWALGVSLEALTRPGLRPVKAPCPTCGRDGAA